MILIKQGMKVHDSNGVAECIVRMNEAKVVKRIWQTELPGENGWQWRVSMDKVSGSVYGSPEQSMAHNQMSKQFFQVHFKVFRKRMIVQQSENHD